MSDWHALARSAADEEGPQARTLEEALDQPMFAWRNGWNSIRRSSPSNGIWMKVAVNALTGTTATLQPYATFAIYCFNGLT